MCSWCYGFSPTWQKLLDNLDKSIEVQYVYGGLSPHSDEPMPQELRDKLQGTWKTIEKQLGTKFNYDFWTKCEPRRSTYLSCQAAVAARVQGKEYEMVKEIQKAYYQNALNPSNRDTLESVAKNVNLDMSKFSHDLESAEIISLFEKDLQLRQSLRTNGFPSLALKTKNKYVHINVDYSNYETILKEIKSYM